MTPTMALLGAQPSARYHLAAAVRSPYVQAVACAEADEQARRELVRAFGIIKHDTDDYRELLADPQISVVDLCVPLPQRAALAVEALQAGKHVLYEPPLAADLSAAQAALTLAQATGRQLLPVAEQLHYPAHQKARQLLATGQLGRPLLTSLLLLHGGDGGQLLPASDQPVTGWLTPGVAAISLVQYLFGPAQAVSATLTHTTSPAPAARADYNTAFINLELPADVWGQITLCTGATGDRPTAERRLVGSEASLLIRDNPEDELPLIMLQGPDMQPLRVPSPLDIHEYALPRTVASLLAGLATSQPPVWTAADDLQALATALTAIEAAPKGCRVEVPPLAEVIPPDEK
jgi:predicted dehydrogenase